MMQSERQTIRLLYMLAGTLLVYVIAHWPALTNPYVINDDVRQQVFWMQQWNDPEIYQNDLLCRYARNYVPWGVQAVYYAGSACMNPVQFSKVVSGILYLVAAGFLFGLALPFRHWRAPVTFVCVFFFFPMFMTKIAGGLAQSFAFPLLLAYLFFLARDNLLGCSLVILFQSVLNPYIFLLCLATHILYLSVNYGPVIFGELWKKLSPAAAARPEASTTRGPDDHPLPTQDIPADGWKITPRLFLVNVPIIAGICLTALKYVAFSPADLGRLVTWAAMQGNPEYTAAGRYEFIPTASFLHELMRPWDLVLPFDGPASFIRWIGMALLFILIVYTYKRYKQKVDLAGFRVFGYLLPASLFMYVLSCLFAFKLFLPERYLEYSLNIFYCVVLGVSFTILPEYVTWMRRWYVPLLVVSILLGGARNYHVGIFNYSSDKLLYDFLKTTPKASLIAGPPVLMDNCLTFARRKAFVTYELSHAWMDKYWSVVKKRTFDLFDAYYADNPQAIRSFARDNGIDYLVVREADFSPESFKKGQIYFEPFHSYILREAGARSHFAALDETSFPIVYRKDGIRILKIGP